MTSSLTIDQIQNVSDLQLDDRMLELMAMCSKSTKMTALTFYPETFNVPFSKRHDEIFELLDSNEQRVVIPAPRGFGKSSIVQKAFISRHILFRLSHYIVPVSCTNSQAIQHTENMKFELEQNREIKGLFGEMKSMRWSQERWITSTDIAIFPRGAGQQIRGLLFRSFRPDLLVVDDLEDKEEVMNEEIRLKTKRWFYTDLMQCIDQKKDDWRLIVIGTILHEDCLLTNLLEDKRWTAPKADENGNRVISIANPITLESEWPEARSNESIKEEMDEYREQGQLDQWYMEMMNMVVPGGERSFSANYFKYYKEEELKLNTRNSVESVVIIDPAKTTNPNSADSAIVGVGVDVENQVLYVRDIHAGKMHPDEMVENAIRMAKQLKATAVGVEETGLNEFVTYPIQNELNRLGLTTVEFLPLKARGKKENRVAALIPFYRRGLIYHNPNCCGKLEAQLLSFPRSKRWDVMDALAYIIAMLEEGERFMEPESYDDAIASIDNDYVDEYEDGYEDEEDEVAGWRVI